MPSDKDPHAGDGPVFVNWPADVLEEPDYPELAEHKLDLACDAIVFAPSYDPDEI